MKAHICNKEKEITQIEVNSATMAQQIKTIQSDVSEIKTDVKSLIAALPKTYSTKEEVAQVAQRLEKIESFKEKILIGILSFVIITAIGAVLWFGKILLFKFWGLG